MAMDKDFASLLYYEVHDLNSVEAFLKTWVSQVLPIEVEESYLVVHQ